MYFMFSYCLFSPSSWTPVACWVWSLHRYWQWIVGQMQQVLQCISCQVFALCPPCWSIHLYLHLLHISRSTSKHILFLFYLVFASFCLVAMGRTHKMQNATLQNRRQLWNIKREWDMSEGMTVQTLKQKKVEAGHTKTWG